MVKKALLVLLGVCAAGGGTTWAVGYATRKDKNNGNKKNTKPRAKPRAAAKEMKPEDFKKIKATWSSSSSSLSNDVPTITITAHKAPSVNWICTVRWKIPTGSMPDFSETNNKSPQIEEKLIKGADANARKSFIKNCTDGKIQGEEDIVTSSDHEILLESQKNDTNNQYILKDLENIYSEDLLKDKVRLTTGDYKILSANDWTINIEKLEGDKDKKITFGSESNNKWQCTAETKNATEELDEDWKTNFETDVLKEKISETNFGSKKKFLLKNCLDNNNAIKLVGSNGDSLTKDKVKELLIKNKYKNPTDDSPKVST